VALLSRGVGLVAILPLHSGQVVHLPQLACGVEPLLEVGLDDRLQLALARFIQGGLRGA